MDLTVALHGLIHRSPDSSLQPMTMDDERWDPPTTASPARQIFALAHAVRTTRSPLNHRTSNRDHEFRTLPKSTAPTMGRCYSLFSRSDRQQEPGATAGDVEDQAEHQGLPEAESVARNQMKQACFDHPDQRLGCRQGGEVGDVGRKEPHEIPESGLSDCANQDCVRQPVWDAEPSRSGIGEDDEAFNHDRERQR